MIKMTEVEAAKQFIMGSTSGALNKEKFLQKTNTNKEIDKFWSE